eukprot:comp11886_c0_seq1/m.6533 comp11886_c0_seq1/g.6533  ORF comp11886_c0_seq1/g.6533 comp11886_c0_seq1/m.6533 type:complete len:104 (-) comp11886_c0_seq1:932-1243(-)
MAQQSKVEVEKNQFGSREEALKAANALCKSYFEWTDQPGKVYGTHSHPHDEVILVLRGSITFTDVLCSKDYSLSVGDKLILPAGTIHNAATKEGCTYLIGSGK